MYQVLVVPLPNNDAGIQAAIKAAVPPGSELISVDTFPGPFAGQTSGQNGLMLMIVFK